MHPIYRTNRRQQNDRFPRIPGVVIQKAGAWLQCQPFGCIDGINGDRRFKRGVDRTEISERLNLDMQRRLSESSTIKIEKTKT
mgnify:CR=1 FL=1